MKEFFGSSARFKIRKCGSDRLLIVDPKASRMAQARWSRGTWTRIIQYANGTLSEENDVVNISALLHDLGWTTPTELTSVAERRAYKSDIIKEAQMARQQVGQILSWIADPGENKERDKEVVQLISVHSHPVTLQLIKGSVVARSVGPEHFLDSLSRFVSESLQRFTQDLARLPAPSPIRICKIRSCTNFFVRDGKHLFCEKHRGPRPSRSTDENRRYKFIRDNLRTPIHKLKRKIESGRLANSRDGTWKLKCLRQIHINLSHGIKKRPIEYLRVS